MVIVLFGVSGAGKTLIGTLLARELAWHFLDADLFHTPESLAKLKEGVPLNDADREPWLELLCERLRDVAGRGGSAVLACSALKEDYRQRLAACAPVRLVYLKGDFELIQARLAGRPGHFLNPKLLPSQFATLEEPAEGAFSVDVRLTPEEIVREIRDGLGI